LKLDPIANGARAKSISRFYLAFFTFSNKAAVNQSKSRKKGFIHLQFCVRQINDALSADKGPVFDARRRVRSFEVVRAHTQAEKVLEPLIVRNLARHASALTLALSRGKYRGNHF